MPALQPHPQVPPKKLGKGLVVLANFLVCAESAYCIVWFFFVVDENFVKSWKRLPELHLVVLNFMAQ